MDLKLAGKTALITGGSKGIGRATGDVLAGEGCKVILVAREPGTLDERYGAKHIISTTGRLARIVGATEIMVNSLHGQAIDRPGEGLVVEAQAPDGTIEAVSFPGAPGFVLGLQWHPEWRWAELPASVAIFRAFGEACRTRATSFGKAA